MAIKPILFSGPMVRAILDGRKTQTRRVLKPQPETRYNTDGEFGQRTGWLWNSGGPGVEGCWHGMESLPTPYAPGDRLWVRETWGHNYFDDGQHRAWKIPVYRADKNGVPMDNDIEQPWLPSTHMPRCVSRLTLEVTDVGIERVQDINEEDALAEGVGFEGDYPQQDFAELWDSFNAKPGYGWDANPWVVAVTFKAHHCNVDQMEVTP